MRRCPKCNRTYETDTQKFCTHDGGLLFAIDPDLSETVQLDSNKIRDAVAKPTTRDLDARLPAQFDPEATVISSNLDPEATIITSGGRDDATVQVGGRDTGELEPQVTQHQITPLAAATSGPIAPPPAPPTSGPIEPTPAPPTSGPIAPPQQTSQPLPPVQPATSGPIGTSAPLPTQQVAPQQPNQPLTAPPPKKKSKLPLILGILAVLFVLGIGVVIAAYLIFVRLRPATRSTEPVVASEPGRSNSNPASAANPAEASQAAQAAPEPYVPVPGAVEFVNSKENLDGKLLEHYVEFSFFYPNGWQKDPKAGVPGASNFAKVERRLPPDFTQENFAVGWYSSSGSAAGDRALYPGLAENLSAQLAANFPEYRKVSEGATKAGVYDGYEFRFEAMSRDTPKGDIKIWGRVIFVPPANGGTSGATLLMLATSLAPELETIDDIGQKGQLPMLLGSFRFGKE